MISVMEGSRDECLTLNGYHVQNDLGDIYQLPNQDAMDKPCSRSTNLRLVGQRIEQVCEQSGEDSSWLGEVNHQDVNG